MKMSSKRWWHTAINRWEFWTILWGFFIVFSIVGLFVTYGKAVKEGTIRLAEQRAAASATYRNCMASIPELRRISVHFAGVNELADTLVANSVAGLRATAKSDPLYEVRVQALNRLVAGQRKIHAARGVPVPTRKQCVERRRSVLGG